MSVKRYYWDSKSDCDCEIVEQPDGAMVDYDEHASVIAALEARCAALAVENAGLKAAIETHKHGFVRCNCCGDELMCHTDDVCRALDDTPATDAFLAEVRASAIEHAASERWGSGYVFDELNEFAAQLRKGVQS